MAVVSSYRTICVGRAAVAFVLLLALVSGAVVAGEKNADIDKNTAEPRNWPEAFSVAFVSNVTTEGIGESPIKGYMWYDWNTRHQRVDHEAGAIECVEFYATDGPCTLYFTPAGMYRVIKPKDGVVPTCCLDMDSIHASPPDWATTANPTYGGVVRDKYSSLAAIKWVFDNLPSRRKRRKLDDKEPHLYFETLDGKPLIFTFPGKDGIQDYHFDVPTYDIGPQDPSIFQLPDGCDSPCTA